MNCTSIKKNLGLYLSGGLSERDRRRIEAHIASCPRCAREVRLYRASYDALDGIEEVRPSGDFQRKLRSRIRRLGTEPAKTRPLRTGPVPVWLRRALAAAACVAVILGLWMLLRPERTRVPTGRGPVLTAQEEQEIIDNLALLENLTVQGKQEIIDNLALLENLDVLDAAENDDMEIYRGERFVAAEVLADSNIDESAMTEILPLNGNGASADSGPTGG